MNLKDIIQITISVVFLSGALVLYQNGSIKEFLTSENEDAVNTKVDEVLESQNTIQQSTTTISELSKDDSDLNIIAIQPEQINHTDTKHTSDISKTTKPVIEKDRQDYKLEKELVHKILNLYIDAIATGTLAVLEDFVTERSKEDWAQFVQNNPYPNGFPRELINIVSISDPDANGRIIVLIKLGDSSPGTMVFMKENGEWKIDLKMYSATEHSFNYEYSYVSKEIQMFRVNVYPYFTTYSDDYISGYNVCTSSYFTNLKTELDKIGLKPICQINSERYLTYVTMSDGINKGINFCSDSAGSHGWTSNKISDDLYKCPEIKH